MDKKSAAAASAAALITDGMIVGLGTGSTATLAVDILGKRVQEGLRIVAVPTSENTAAQAKALGIPLASLSEISEIDVTIDGADEVEVGTLNLIKGHGGALLREKIVASVSKRLVIVVDDSKIVEHLGAHFPVPVEVIPFGWEATARQLAKLDAKWAIRLNKDGTTFVSDGGHYILDCAYPITVAPLDLARALDHIVGLVEHGLFLGFPVQAHVASDAEVNLLER